jgi:hypothetical protein
LNDKPKEQSIESIAYREAGHVLMAYLIVEAGITDSSFAVPISQGGRELLVPEFNLVAADGELSKLTQPTFSLRSLITVPLFIFAGFAAQRIYEDPSTPPIAGNSRAEGLARGLMHGYWEEFDRDRSGPDSTLTQAIKDSNDLAYQMIREHWHAVQSLAQRLLEEGELSRDEAFEAIQHYLAEGDGTAEQGS